MALHNLEFLVYPAPATIRARGVINGVSLALHETPLGWTMVIYRTSWYTEKRPKDATLYYRWEYSQPGPYHPIHSAEIERIVQRCCWEFILGSPGMLVRN